MFIVMVRVTVKNMFLIRVIIYSLHFDFTIQGKDLNYRCYVKDIVNQNTFLRVWLVLRLVLGLWFKNQMDGKKD